MNRVVLRNGTSSEWITHDPVLYEGEIGLETDTNRFKIGNGSDLWTELPYIGVSKTGDSMSGILDMLNNKIINVSLPVNDKDASNKEYVDKKGITQGDTPPVGGEEGQLWLDTSADSTQATVFHNILADLDDFRDFLNNYKKTIILTQMEYNNLSYEDKIDSTKIYFIKED